MGGRYQNRQIPHLTLKIFVFFFIQFQADIMIHLDKTVIIRIVLSLKQGIVKPALTAALIRHKIHKISGIFLIELFFFRTEGEPVVEQLPDLCRKAEIIHQKSQQGISGLQAGIQVLADIII